MSNIGVWGWDGANSDWVKLLLDAAGHVQVDIVTGTAVETRCHGYDGSNWQTLLVESSAQKNLRTVLYDAGNKITSDNFGDTQETTARGIATLSAVYGRAGDTWYAVHAAQGNADELAATDYGLNVNARLVGYNGATWDRLRVGTPADAFTTPTYALEIMSFLMGYDGSDWNMVRVDASGHLQIDVLSSALPTGAPNYGQANVRNQLLSLSYTVLNTRLPSALDTDSLKVREQGTPSVHLYGYDGTNWQTLLVESSTQKNLRVGIYDSGDRVRVVTAHTTFNAGIKGLVTASVMFIGEYPNALLASASRVNADDVTAGFAALNTASYLYGFDGSKWDRLRTYGTGILKVGRAEVGLLTVRKTAAGQVGATGARKLYWITMNPSVAASVMELTDDTAALGTVEYDHYHANREAHHVTLDPPMEFSNGIYLETFTNMTSIIFGYL